MTPKNDDLDQIDRALLRALSLNARASGAALAAELGVAESTISVRMRRLHHSGHLRGYRAIVDLAALGGSLQALVEVRLGRHARAQIDDFRSSAPHWPGVISLFHMGGADDYLLHVAAANAAGLRDFVLEHLAEHPAVAHTETNIIFEHVEGDGWHKLAR